MRRMFGLQPRKSDNIISVKELEAAISSNKSALSAKRWVSTLASNTEIADLRPQKESSGFH